MKVNWMFIKLALLGLVGIGLSLYMKSYWAERYLRHSPDLNMTKFQESKIGPYLAVGFTIVCIILAFVAREKVSEE